MWLDDTLPRSNQYDSEELEYWVDFRTEGSHGYSETDGVLESRAADTTGANGFAMPGINDDPMCELPVQGSGAPGLQKESDKACNFIMLHEVSRTSCFSNLLNHPLQGELVVSKIMDEAIQTRRSLDKLVAKLKKENGHKKILSCTLMRTKASDPIIMSREAAGAAAQGYQQHGGLPEQAQRALRRPRRDPG